MLMAAGRGKGPASSRDKAPTEFRERTGATGHKFSFFLEAIPSRILPYLNSRSIGFGARIVAVFAVGSAIVISLNRALRKGQDHIPLAKRWNFVQRWTPVTLIERTRDEGTKMEVFKFALPNPYDYPGYEPISSVLICSPGERRFGGVKRWFTPISHPQQRGIIEFAIKDADPGRMAGRLLRLRPGDQLFLGKWMKEYPYKAGNEEHVGIIASTGCVSVIMQVLNAVVTNPRDKTKVDVLFCNASASSIPLNSRLQEYAAQRPDQIRISYCVQSIPKTMRDSFSGYLGNIDEAMVKATLPPPMVPVTEATRPQPAPEATDATAVVAADSASAKQFVKSRLLVCGNQILLQDVCGRSFTFANKWYVQGGRLQWHGLLPDMGYTRDQVYKFGTSTHFLAFH